MKCARTLGNRLLCGIVVLSALSVSTVAATPAIATAQEDPSSGPASGECHSLFVLGVEGTGESSAASATGTAVTGLLATVMDPLTKAIGQRVGRAYVPYPAAFGGALPGALVPYSASAAEGLGQLRDMATEVLDRCPRTQLGLIGYSQGAHVVSMFAREVGTGGSAVPADRVAAVALLADPTRAPGAPILPGLPGRDRPDPAPGTTGAELGTVPGFSQRAMPGGGIGPLSDIAADFGALTGRVASLCLPGDLACDAPPDVPLLHMIVNILGQAELVPSDPLAALTSISDAFSATLSRTATSVVNHDLSGYSLGTLSLTPEKPLSVRLAEAADPRSSGEPEARQALFKLGTSALNTLLAIVGVALTPAEVAGIATAPDPLTGLRRTADALVTAVGRPVPQRTVFNLVSKTFDSLGALSADNAELLDPAQWLRYADTVRRHVDYPNAVFTSDGRSATGLILGWFTAVATDLAIHRIPAPRPAPPLAAPAPGAGPPVAPAPVPPPTTGTPGDPARQVADGPRPATGEVRETTSARSLPRPAGYLVPLLVLIVVSAGAACAIRWADRIRRVRVPAVVAKPDPRDEPSANDRRQRPRTTAPGTHRKRCDSNPLRPDRGAGTGPSMSKPDYRR
ncbi:cutinase family protein [Nocardia sp. NPDC024068]|uniref:cutinase family protein n=1 Tax=Nocardia sp. NPDC024068 TaxID=3157197 RepID=UPI0033F4E885